MNGNFNGIFMNIVTEINTIVTYPISSNHLKKKNACSTFSKKKNLPNLCVKIRLADYCLSQISPTIVNASYG